MPDCFHSSLLPNDSVDPGAWQASLRLRFEKDGATTRLTERSHRGPLRVQKALYPEGEHICHAIVIHPPGGVVGGDRLNIDVGAGAGAHAFLTTPGAAKWYRANGKLSVQDVRIEAGAGACVEWLPQETIFFNDARVELNHTVNLAADASYIGGEILCFGRSASGERFASGTVAQRTCIRRNGRLLWWEQGLMDACGPVMHSVFGLNGATVCATLICIGKPLAPPVLGAMRAIDPALAVTQIKSVFVARLLCDDSERARSTMAALWQHVRMDWLGCAAAVPRIWNT
jgi:urease accessory protein